MPGHWPTSRHASAPTRSIFLYRGNGYGGFKAGSTQIGNNWGSFDTIISPAPRRPRPSTPARSNNLSKPVYFVHGYDMGIPQHIYGYWGAAIEDFEGDGDPAKLSPSNSITFCYYSRLTGCSVNVGGNQNVAIVDVAAALAWDIYNRYSRYGVAVDVVAHSMGGLVARGALTGVRKQDSRFPPYLFVEDAVTISTPNAGATWGAGVFCKAGLTVQCDDMMPSSAYLGWLDPAPSSKIYTDWTFIGLDNDPVIVPSTAVPDSVLVSHKVIYDGGQISAEYAHMEILDAVSGSYSYLYCDLDVTINHYCDGRSRYAHVESGYDPVKMVRNAVYWNAWY